ncbi:MAG: hypothetical protein K2G63_05440 [Oscillospiraceae bacterium]|nr:hypothetical protein [Oscillospiraceae bacterium]
MKKKFNYLTASALALSFAVSAVIPTVANIPAVYAESEDVTVKNTVSGHEIPSDYYEADKFYNQIGEISYCACGQIVTCVPVADVYRDLKTTYILDGEELYLTPQRNFEPTETLPVEGYTPRFKGYESVAFFGDSKVGKHTLKINVEFAAKSSIESEPLPTVYQKEYVFEYEVDENHIIIPNIPNTFRQTEKFMENYGNYQLQGDKIIVCTPCFSDGGYNVVVDSNATLLSESSFSSDEALTIDDTGYLMPPVPGAAVNKVLVFDASKEGTYSVDIFNKREWENETHNHIIFTYNVDKDGKVTFDDSASLQIPQSYEEAKEFIEKYGESETDGKRVISVIPVINSEDFSIEPSSETQEIKPYTKQTQTYYYNSKDKGIKGCKGYMVTTYTMKTDASENETLINSSGSLFQVIRTKCDHFEEVYKIHYLINKETGKFEEYSVEPQSLADCKVFENKYGTFAVDQNQKKVVAVVPGGYVWGAIELSDEGSAKMLEEKYCYNHYFIDDEGNVMHIDDGGGYKILTFDASKTGTYSIKLDDRFGMMENSSCEYTVDENGNISLKLTEITPPNPVITGIETYDEADAIFKENGGYLINDKEISIVIPNLIYCHGYDEEYNGIRPEFLKEIKVLNPDVLGFDTLDDDTQVYIPDRNVGYTVYTYDLGMDISFITTNGDCILAPAQFPIDFSVTYKTYNSNDVITPEDDIFYTFRFNIDDNGKITNTGVVSKDSGDANNDGTVDVADVVAIAAHIGNPEQNSIPDKAKIYCDVQAHGNGLDASDALMIQQYLAKVITEF